MRTREEQDTVGLLRQLEADAGRLDDTQARAGLREIAAARARLRRLDARLGSRAHQLRRQLEARRQATLPGLGEL
jgi:hypothetical protein